MTEPAKGLSPREREVLARLADGKSNKKVARELGLSALDGEGVRRTHSRETWRAESGSCRGGLAPATGEGGDGRRQRPGKTAPAKCITGRMMQTAGAKERSRQEKAWPVLCRYVLSASASVAVQEREVDANVSRWYSDMVLPV